LDERVYSRYMSDLSYFMTKLEEYPYAKYHLPIAVAFLKLEKYEEAILVCKAALETFPTHCPTKTLLAEGYINIGNLELAKDILIDVVAEDESNYKALKLLGQTMLLLNNDESAAKYYKTAYILAPEDEDILKVIKDLNINISLDTPLGDQSKRNTDIEKQNNDDLETFDDIEQSIKNAELMMQDLSKDFNLSKSKSVLDEAKLEELLELASKKEDIQPDNSNDNNDADDNNDTDNNNNDTNDDSNDNNDDTDDTTDDNNENNDDTATPEDTTAEDTSPKKINTSSTPLITDDEFKALLKSAHYEFDDTDESDTASTFIDISNNDLASNELANELAGLDNDSEFLNTINTDKNILDLANALQSINDATVEEVIDKDTSINPEGEVSVNLYDISVNNITDLDTIVNKIEDLISIADTELIGQTDPEFDNDALITTLHRKEIENINENGDENITPIDLSNSLSIIDLIGEDNENTDIYADDDENDNRFLIEEDLPPKSISIDLGESVPFHQVNIFDEVLSSANINMEDLEKDKAIIQVGIDTLDNDEDNNDTIDPSQSKNTNSKIIERLERELVKIQKIKDKKNETIEVK